MEQKKKRLFYLDLVRVIAMLFVVIYHFFKHYEISFNITGFNPLKLEILHLNLGFLGVSLFFIISGVSLMYNYGEKIEYKKYFKKRIKSIYPMFWIAYLIVFFTNFMNNGNIDNTIPRRRLILSILGVDGYFQYLVPNFYILGEWFLGAIVFLYIIFPLYRWLAKKSRFLTISILIVHCILSVYIIQYNPFLAAPNKNIIVCLFSFLVGMCFIEYIKDVKWYYALFCVITFLLTIFIKIPVSEYLISLFSAILLFMVLVYISKFIKNQTIHLVLNKLSKYSYPIFLVHHVLIMRIESKFANRTLDYLETGCLFTYYFLITVVVAIVLNVITKKIIDIFSIKDLEERKDGKI